MHVIPAARVAVALHPPPDPVETSFLLDSREQTTTRRAVFVAAQQGGQISRVQLLAVGWSSPLIGRSTQDGWLLPQHRGVFSVGHPPRTHEERWWGCVLACGPQAKTSAGTSAAAHGLLLPHARVHITAPTKRSRPGMANHTAETETVWIDGLPCCTVDRTLLDLAGCVPHRVLESACRQAQVRGVLDLEALGRLMLDLPRARGVRRLRAILGDPVVLAPTRSHPERVALRALLDAGFPWPDVGKEIDGEEVDFTFPHLMAGLEIDGATHLTQVQMARDAARDAKLAALGWRIVRVRDVDAASAPAALRRAVDSSRGVRRIDDSMGGGGGGRVRGAAA